MDQTWCLSCMSPLVDGGCPNHCPPVPANEPHMLQPGTLLNGRYLMGRSLGHGGFGITYIGRDTVLNIPVAVKEFFPTGIATRDIAQSPEIHVTGAQNRESLQREVEKFLQEARTLAQFLDEPGIVSVRDFFSANGTAYIVTEYIKGETLRAYQTRLGRIPLEDLLVLLAPVCQSLTKVHQAGLIHRDISPDNIMITPDGRAKLLDFGTVRSASLAGEHSMSVILKPGYAPEEQYRRRGEQGAWTDVYGLAATIYRCITGVTPDDAFQRMYQDELQLPSKLGVAISAAQETALMKGLAIRHEDRYLTVEALINALTQKDEEHVETRKIFESREVAKPEEKQIEPEKKPAQAEEKKTKPEEKPVKPEEKKSGLEEEQKDSETALFWSAAGKAAEEKHAGVKQEKTAEKRAEDQQKQSKQPEKAIKRNKAEKQVKPENAEKSEERFFRNAAGKREEDYARHEFVMEQEAARREEEQSKTPQKGKTHLPVLPGRTIQWILTVLQVFQAFNCLGANYNTTETWVITGLLLLFSLVATWSINKSWGAKIALSVIAILYLGFFNRTSYIYMLLDYQTVTWVALLVSILCLVLTWITKRDTVSLRNKTISLKTLEKWSRMKHLTHVHLKGCRLQTFRDFQYIPNLRDLTLTDCGLMDLDGFSMLTGLTSLDLSKNRIDNIARLQYLTGLERLDISGNRISDLTPISHLTSLTDLDISRNQITDLRPITGLRKLRRLGVAGNLYRDLSPLASLDGLQTLLVYAEQRMILGPTEKIPGLKIKNVPRQ